MFECKALFWSTLLALLKLLHYAVNTNTTPPFHIKRPYGVLVDKGTTGLFIVLLYITTSHSWLWHQHIHPQWLKQDNISKQQSVKSKEYYVEVIKAVEIWIVLNWHAHYHRCQEYIHPFIFPSLYLRMGSLFVCVGQAPSHYQRPSF